MLNKFCQVLLAKIESRYFENVQLKKTDTKYQIRSNIITFSCAAEQPVLSCKCKHIMLQNLLTYCRVEATTYTGKCFAQDLKKYHGLPA